MKRFVLKVICISAFFVAAGAITQKIDGLFQPDEPTFVFTQNRIDEKKLQFKTIRNVSAIETPTTESRKNTSTGSIQFQVSAPEKTFSVKTFRFDSPDGKSFTGKKKIIVVKSPDVSATPDKTAIE